MTTAAQSEVTDEARARAAKAKAQRVLPTEIADAVVHRLEDGINLPNFTHRGRWRTLITEVTGLPEESR